MQGERAPHCPHRRGAALELVQSTLDAARAVWSPGELRLQTSLQLSIRTHFFGSDWYLSQMPCLPNKQTSFPNFPLLWSKNCLLTGQKLSCFSTCVTWTWGEFKVLIMWLFHSLFLLLTIFHFTLIRRVLLSLSNLTCLFLCNENPGSRYIMWYTVPSSHNTVGSPCYGIKTTHGRCKIYPWEVIAFFNWETILSKTNLTFLVSDTQTDFKKEMVHNKKSKFQ